MSKPSEEVREKSYYKDIYFLYEVLNSLKNVDEVKLFTKDILSRSELRMLKRRWHIANLLYEGSDVRTVAIRARTSTQTVMKIKKQMDEGTGGLILALQRVKKAERRNHQVSRKKGSKYVKSWF